MNDKQRVTIYLPKEIARFAKVLAATKGTSVSQLVEIYFEQQKSDVEVVEKLRKDFH